MWYNLKMPIYKEVDKNFFKKWTKDMAYIVGFFAADGYITINKKGGHFWCIQITDKDLLYKIRNCLCSKHKIGERVLRKGTKKLYRLQIGSKEICGDIFSLGFTVGKTKSIVIPNVPNKYFSDFVRGYFDGDGNVWVGLIHKERKTKTLAISVVFTSCSNMFLRGLKGSLESFGIDRGVIRKSDRNYHRLTYSILSSLKLFNFMYNRMISEKNDLFLNRKKTVFDRYINMRA